MSHGDELSPSTSELVDALADLLEEGSNIYLEDILVSPERVPDTAWTADRAEWITSYGSDDVAGWVSEISGIYLAEAAHILRALATLLRTHRIFAAQDLIVRSVVERIGHVNWILDHRISSGQRAARAGLEIAACFYMYRDALSLLDGDRTARTEIKKRANNQQSQLKQWFEVVQPPGDPCDESSPPTGDVTRWVVDGEKFPNLTKAAEYVLERGGIEGQAARGTYAGLSGFSHPNVVFSAEHNRIDAEGRITFLYEWENIEKAARMALLGFTDGVKHWVGYFDTNPVGVIASLDSIADRLDALGGTSAAN
jgi:hypothetical protein